MARRDDDITRCSICQQTPVGSELPRIVCRRCDAMALTDAARPAAVAADGQSGDNPVYIDARQCWRLYDAGGYATLLDADNCRDLDDFCRKNKLAPPRDF